MLLSPHHFQLQDFYHEQRVADQLRSERMFSYGFNKLVLDEAAVQNGQIRIEETAGVFPSMAPFRAPEREEPPEARNVDEHFPIKETELPVYLGVRLHRPGQIQVSSGDDHESRFRRVSVAAMDEVTGEDEREVEVARTNLMILFPDDPLGEYDVLPLARVVRKPEGGYTYLKEFVPPLLSVEGSPYLLRLLQRLLEILVTRSTELSDRRRHSGKGAAEFGRDDVAGFWLLGTLNGAIPRLTHYLRFQGCSGEMVYLMLADLAGRLTTLSDQSPRDIPAYEHDHSGPVFKDLGTRIPGLLEISLPKNYARIPLTKMDQTMYTAAIQDDRHLDGSVSWFLGVTASLSTEEIQRNFPEKVKIASPDRVDFLLAHALTGVGLTLAQTLPASLPAQGNYVYFKMEKSGEVWDLVAGSRNLSIYIPPEFPGIHLELIAVWG